MKKYICFQFIICMAAVFGVLFISYTNKLDNAKKIIKYIVTDSSQIHEAEGNIAKIVSGIVVGD